MDHLPLITFRVRLRAMQAFIFYCLLSVLVAGQWPAPSVASSANADTASFSKLRCISNEVKKSLSHVHFDAHANRSLVIKLQTSDRPSHQLITSILKILIQDVIGYDSVELVYGANTLNTSVALDAVAGLSRSGLFHEEPPDMVNIELWMPPLFQIDNWDGHNKAEYLGPLGPVGKFGWFVSSGFADEQWKKLGISLDFWRDYETDDAAGLLDLRREPDYFRVQEYAGSAKACGAAEGCRNGIFFPSACQSSRNPCAIMLASHYTDESARTIRQIETHQLKVAIAFVGNQLENLIRTRETKGQPTLFFGYDPSVITAQWSFRPVLFRPCTPDELDDDCDFTVNQLSKAASAHIKHKASDVFALLHKMSIFQEDYHVLLRRYALKPQQERDSYASSSHWSQRVACEWVQNNTNRWLPWVTSNETKRLLLGGIFPLYSETFSQGDPCWGVSLEIAARIAVEAVNSNRSVLHGHELTMYSCNGACATAESLYCFVTDRQQKDLVGIVGSACSDAIEPLLGFGKYSKTMMVSYGAEASGLSDRNKYPYFYRTTPDNLQYGPVYASILREVGWSRVGAVSEDGQKYPEYLTAFQKFFSKLHIEYSSYKIPRGAKTSHEISDVVKQIKGESMRIIIGDFYEDQARAVMCAAYRNNMTASDGYVWFLPNWFSAGWYKTSQQVDNLSMCTTEEMIAAINHHFTLEYSYLESQEATKTVAGYTVSEFRARLAEKIAKADYDKHRCTKGIQEHKYVGYAHDAVWAIALALDRIARNFSGIVPVDQLSKSLEVAQAYSKYLGELEFQGVSGHIAFNGSNRIGDIIVRQRVWNVYNMSQDPVEEVIGRYETKPRIIVPVSSSGSHLQASTSSSSGAGVTKSAPSVGSTSSAYFAGPTGLMLSQNAIKWGTPNRRKPSDGGIGYCLLEPIRAVLGFTCERTWLVTVIITIILGTILTVTMLCICVIRFSYTKKLKNEQDTRKRWQMRIGGDILSLAEWEMPRSNIHANRRLGHGAFGVVYGGEAILLKKPRPEGSGGGDTVDGAAESNTPVNVAIKTLYQNAAPGERLDFLAEAEVMKRLNHENIIKLYGVCTEGRGPFSIVVEFMLYGDMKTYLLGRRDKAINEPNDEITLLDVGPERLTIFARDITSGLQYLHSERLVHRDLAARNCLVSAERRVKLSDFGLCRPIYESGYYRFTRKAMMPVRWMAPESLDDGVFSPASDIWGLGVVFFEITTLGGFPFPGKNNAQVLDFVKRGGRLSPPEMCPPLLSTLMLQTWDFDPAKRPNTSTILKLFQEHPTLFCACVQSPAAMGSEAINADGHENVGASVTGGPGGGGGGALSLKHQLKSYPPAIDNNERAESGQPSSSGGGRVLTPSGGGRPALVAQQSEPARHSAATKMLDVSGDAVIPSRAGGGGSSTTTTKSGKQQQEQLTPNTTHSRAQDRRRTVPEDTRSRSPLITNVRETNMTTKQPLLAYRRELSDDAFLGSDEDDSEDDDDNNGEYLQIADENSNMMMHDDTSTALLPHANVGGGLFENRNSSRTVVHIVPDSVVQHGGRHAPSVAELHQQHQNMQSLADRRFPTNGINVPTTVATRYDGGAGDVVRYDSYRLPEHHNTVGPLHYSQGYYPAAGSSGDAAVYARNFQNPDTVAVTAQHQQFNNNNSSPPYNLGRPSTTAAGFGGNLPYSGDTLINTSVDYPPPLSSIPVRAPTQYETGSQVTYHGSGNIMAQQPQTQPPTYQPMRPPVAGSVGAITSAHRRILEQMNSRKSIGDNRYDDEFVLPSQELLPVSSANNNAASFSSPSNSPAPNNGTFDPLLRSAQNYDTNQRNEMPQVEARHNSPPLYGGTGPYEASVTRLPASMANDAVPSSTTLRQPVNPSVINGTRFAVDAVDEPERVFHNQQPLSALPLMRNVGGSGDATNSAQQYTVGGSISPTRKPVDDGQQSRGYSQNYQA